MLDGAYDFYAAFPFFLSIPVGESFPIPSATESPSSFEDFYPWTSHFLPTRFLKEWFLVGKNPTLLVVMKMLKWVLLWILAHPQLFLFDVMLKSHVYHLQPWLDVARWRCVNAPDGLATYWAHAVLITLQGTREETRLRAHTSVVLLYACCWSCIGTLFECILRATPQPCLRVVHTGYVMPLAYVCYTFEEPLLHVCNFLLSQ